MKRKLRLDARLWERGIIAFIASEQNAADGRNFPSKTVHHSLAGGKPDGALAPSRLRRVPEPLRWVPLGLFIPLLCLVKEGVYPKKSFRRQRHSRLRRRRGAHGQSGSHVGAAGDWQRLQLPGPLTLCAQNRSHCGSLTLRLRLLPLCRQVPAPLLGTGGVESSVPSELQALPSRGNDYIQRAQCGWTHRRFNGMHEPGTVAGSLKNQMNAGDRSRLPQRVSFRPPEKDGAPLRARPFAPIPRYRP